MGVKKLFGMKPPEDESIEENRTNLNSMGIPVKMTNRIRKSKFDAFNLHSKEKSQGVRQFQPVEAKVHTFASGSPELTSNPYANFSYDEGSPYNSPPANRNTTQGSPYGGVVDNTYTETAVDTSQDLVKSPYGLLSSPTYSTQNNTPSSYGLMRNSSNGQSNGLTYANNKSFTPSYGLVHSPNNEGRVVSPMYGRINTRSSSRHSYGQRRSPSASISDHLYPETSLTSPPITPITKNPGSFSDNHSYDAPSMNNNTLLNPYRARRSTMSSNRSLSRNVSLTREDPDLKNAKLALFETHSNSSDPYSAEYGDLQSGMDHLQITPTNEMATTTVAQEQEEDLNAIPEYLASVNLNEEPELETRSTHQSYDSYSYQPSTFNFETERQQQLEQEQAEEDEEVDRIKQDIKFTKQQSVASTRNTLRMANEAEASGLNTLGMLGSQSEKLYGIERDLLLARTQNVVATDKVKEMSKMDRNFMLVHVSNPFNSKRRMQRQEDRIRNQRTEDNLIQQKLREQQYRTEGNIIAGLQDAESEEYKLPVNSKYDRLRRLERASKYQFEQNEEDDEMELEISKNLDAIETSTQKLNNMARSIGQEVQTQQNRWRRVEDDTDKLEMEIHLNNHRLAGVMK